MPLAAQLLFALLIGLAFGSFGTMLLHRFPKEMGILGRSRCPRCSGVIAWYDLLPLLSYFLLRGSCRSCKKPISVSYPLFEGVTALLAILLVLQFRGEPLHVLLLTGIAGFFLLLIAFHDFSTQKIPDLFTSAVFFSALLLSLLRKPDLILLSAISGGAGAFLLFAFFGSLWLVSGGKWIGSGDVLLGGAIGLLLGFPLVLLVLFFAYTIGGAVAAFLLVTGHARRGTPIAFGPFLCTSAIITTLFGNELVALYLGLL